MTAKEASEIPMDEPKVVGDVQWCFTGGEVTLPDIFVCPRDDAGVLKDDLCKVGHCCHLEHPAMAPHVLSLLRQGVVAPVKVGSQMKITLPNRCVPPNREGRYTTTTFRAKRTFHGKAWYDTIRYRFVENSIEEPGVPVQGLGYGRCVCFYEGADGKVGVILRCYNPFVALVSAVGTTRRRTLAPELFDYDSQLAPVHLMEVTDRYSYMRVDLDCIVNGGLVLADPIVHNKFWIVQGHREKGIYLAHNGG